MESRSRQSGDWSSRTAVRRHRSWRQILPLELLPRLTSHIRHKAKYLDVQLIEEQAFVFTANDGVPVGMPARTLKEFCYCLKTCRAAVLAGHAQRNDFSRWIIGVFHDRLLASQIRKIEQRHKLGHERDLASSLAKTILDRYEFSVGDSIGVTRMSDANHTAEPALSVT